MTTFQNTPNPLRTHDPIAQQARREVGAFIADLHFQTLPGAGNAGGGPAQVMDDQVLDYVTQVAGNFAVQWYNFYFHNPARTQSIGWAKAWAAGYFAWYFPNNPTPLHLQNRDDVAHQPDFWETAYRGALAIAMRVYPNIPWTLQVITDQWGPWMHPAITDEGLRRINMNLQGETVQSWDLIHFRPDVFGPHVACHLPRICSNAGVELQIGDELYSDWVVPKDANHGHPMTTVRRLFAASRGGALVENLTRPKEDRESYRIVHARAKWRIVYKPNANPPFIITFFKEP